MNDSFSTTEVAKILGKTPRFVIDWAERGLFYADIQPASGPGSKRRFSYPAVLAAALVLTLKEKLDLPRRVVLNVAEWMQEDKFIWPWNNLSRDEALKKYGEETVRRIEEERKTSILPAVAESKTFICTFYVTGQIAMMFARDEILGLLNSGGLEIGTEVAAMICVDLTHIKAAVDNGIKELA